jgi:hypothetical protein
MSSFFARRLLLQLFFLLVPLCLHASSQGLYIISPPFGQLTLVNYTSNERINIGRGISSLGWDIPHDCSPTAIDTTGKWMYVFARNSSVPSPSPWHVLSIELRDGSIRKDYALPPIFPPTLSACEHSISEDGGWHAYVTAVTRGATIPHLIMWRFTYTWPFSNESSLLIDVPLSSLDMGLSGPVLTSAVTNFTAWLSLEKGLVGLDLTTLLPSRRLPITEGCNLSGLQYSISGQVRRTYGLLNCNESNETFIADFVDRGSGIPILSTIRTAIPTPLQVANRVALLNDYQGGGAITLATNESLVTLNLLHGTVVATISACKGESCPIACAYEPLVF